MSAERLTDAGLYRLLTWLSPSYPVGAYTYSHGLEAAVEAGLVGDEASAAMWIGDLVARGGGFADGVFFCAAHRSAVAGDWDGLAETGELACAFAPSAELLTETSAQGRAFAEVTTALAMSDEDLALLRRLEAGRAPIVYPVAVGCAAGETGVSAGSSVIAYLHAFAANLVSACLRLAPVGQTAGQRILAGLKPLVAETATSALATPLDDLAVSTLAADISSMRHETQYARLFRS